MIDQQGSLPFSTQAGMGHPDCLDFRSLVPTVPHHRQGGEPQTNHLVSKLGVLKQKKTETTAQTLLHFKFLMI